MSTKRQENFTNQGAKAFLKGEPITKNPYDPIAKQKLYDLWNRGWLAKKLENEEAIQECKENVDVFLHKFIKHDQSQDIPSFTVFADNPYSLHLISILIALMERDKFPRDEIDPMIKIKEDLIKWAQNQFQSQMEATEKILSQRYSQSQSDSDSPT